MDIKNNQAIQTIGRVLPDGTILEEIYDPKTEKGKLVVAQNGNFEPVEEYRDPITHVVFRPLIDDSIRKGFVNLPSAIGDRLEPSCLMEQTTSFINSFVDIEERDNLALIAAYVIMTYMYDRFEKVPYLRFWGPYGSGKSRALKTVKGICYHPINLGSSQTAPNIFRSLDKYGLGTMMLDEANFTDTTRTSDLAKILNDGYSRDGVVSRCDPKTFDPKFYHVFSPKILANHTAYDDPALESRMFSIIMKPTNRRDIPYSIPDLLYDNDAISIRNNLLRYRLDNYSSLDLQRQFTELMKFDARTRELSLALLLSQKLSFVPDYLLHFLSKYQEDQRQGNMFDDDAIVAKTVMDFLANSQQYISLSEFTRAIEDHDHILIQNKRAAHCLRQIGALSSRASQGMMINLRTINVDFLKNRYGVQ